MYADIGNDDDICLPCGRLPGVTSRVLIDGVESTPQGSLLCHLKVETNLASAGIEPGSPDSRPDTQALCHETPLVNYYYYTSNLYNNIYISYVYYYSYQFLPC